MDIAVLVTLVALVVAFLVGIKLRSHYSSLPGPGLRAYLPNGTVFRMFADSRRVLRSLISMQEEYGDVYQLYFGPSDTVVTAVPADIVQALSSNSFVRPEGMRAMFQDVVPGSLFTMPPELHFAARRNLRENFSYSVLEGMHPHIVSATDELCESLLTEAQKTKEGESPHTTNITEQLSITTFRVITNAAFGCSLSRDDRKKFAEITDELVLEMLKDLTGYPLRHALSMFGLRDRLLHCVQEMNTFCRRFIDQRKQESKEEREKRPTDILDVILSMSEDEHTSTLSQTIVFAIAGSHSTNEVLAWTVYELCRHPEVVRKIQEELRDVLGQRSSNEPLNFGDVDKLTYLQNVWKETLRIHPAGGFIIREAAKDTKLKGSNVNVRKGDLVLSLMLGAQMNSSIWTEPKKFIPERWNSSDGEGTRAPAGSFVPFSVGPRNCAGRFLADYEGVLVLAEMYRRFEFDLACTPSEVVSCTGWIESAKCCIDGSDYGFGVPVHVKVRE